MDYEQWAFMSIAESKYIDSGVARLPQSGPMADN
jgi:hypothetical protein